MGDNLSLLFTLTILLVLIPQTSMNVRHKRQTVNDYPRIVTENGHLYFRSASSRNISFVSGQGGGIYLDNVDFKVTMTQISANNASLGNLQTSFSRLDNQFNARVPSLETQLSTVINLPSRVNQLNADLTQVGQRITALESSQTSTSVEELRSDLNALRQRVTELESTSDAVTAATASVTRRVTDLENIIRNLQTQLNTNYCASNPCQHGGTCSNTFNGFQCRCPTNWQGVRCDEDVNECSIYMGTDLGCHNGATCINTQGSFSCQCRPGWSGIHCNSPNNSCDGASHWEMCDHGVCINDNNQNPSRPRYRCLCDSGWTSNITVSPACNIDIDECRTGTHCSVNPPVQCINIPGSFVCGSCPAGYSGSGYSCYDTDECQDGNNGGCSRNPYVECINTIGSSTCGRCPTGYQGNGRICTASSYCSYNNGGCHNSASCIEGASGRLCICQNGYIGNGEGPNGCIQQSMYGSCNSNPCANGGTCTPAGTGVFTCTCPSGYTGPTCNSTANACNSNPCQNGGTCVSQGAGFICNCPEGFTGFTCGIQQQVCGGRLLQESGLLRYPATNSSYPPNADCKWVISTTVDKIVQVTFTSFSMEHHDNCIHDFLQLNDGPTTSSRFMGRYCGLQLPNGGSLINSTQHELSIWFKSDYSVEHYGFSLTWTSAQPACGGTFSGSDHGAINSPNYPNNYPHNSNCSWIISVQPGYTISFQFASLDIEQHPDCRYDYLEIYDGASDSAPVLQRLCGMTTGLPPPIQTSGPNAFIRFHSDPSENGQGFSITYSSSIDTTCGGTFTSETGVISSPNYPNNYPHGKMCSWVIRRPTTSRISFTFLAFDLQTTAGCSSDYLMIRDGENYMGDLLAVYCGSNQPAAVQTNGNVAYIEFRSDETSSGAGFRIQWTTECGGVYTNSSGSIQSPGWPGDYHASADCSFIIQASDSQNVLLTFDSFVLEADSSCAYDYLEIRDGSSETAPLLGSRYCGQNTPVNIRSTGNALFVKFVTDDSVQHAGFHATYSMVDDGGASMGCGGTLNRNSGIIRSPVQANVYPHGINCTWYIMVDQGHIVRLEFHTFSFEHGYNTCHDYIEIYDNITATGPSLGRFCRERPPVITSSENYLTVVMITDSSVAYDGFYASFVALNTSTFCGGALTATSGEITSPNFPQNYPHHRQCEWTITVPRGRQIFLNFTSFHLEPSDTCNWDFLEIRDGGSANSPLKVKLCGYQEAVPLIRSYGNRLYLKFKTDATVTHPGFRLEYGSSASGCYGDLNSPTGTITSPDYPESYAHNTDCIWTITVAQGNSIIITFAEIDLENSYSCRYDYLMIREEGETGKMLGKFCGRTLPHPIYTESNKLWIKFKSDQYIEGRGFSLQYLTNCNKNFTGFGGVIESPNYPNSYLNNLNCTWFIKVNKGNKINLEFATFYLENFHDYLQITDVQNSSQSRRLTGNTIPQSYNSSGNVLKLNFITDRSIVYSGFRLEWAFIGCGGILQDPTGTFTSPNFPNPYNRNIECVWKIIANLDQAIELTFPTFQLEAHDRCEYDYVKVFEGGSDQGPLLTQLCHSVSNQIITSHGNQLLIKFMSDESFVGNGFNATYRAIPGGCGGNFSAMTATIMSKNYPQNYDRNSICNWRITVGEGHNVVLTFTDFALGNCPNDYVEIFDVIDSNEVSLGRLCDNQLPNQTEYRSTGNQMSIRMLSLQGVKNRGFRAQYITGCGGTLNADLGGSIQTPFYPNQYPFNTTCIWIIRSSTLASKVHLSFTYMNIPDVDGCQQSYVTVNDGTEPLELHPNQQQTRYCGNNIPAPYYSQDFAIYVVFRSGASYRTGNGFRAVYSSSLASCGGDDITAISGQFQSPNYPNNYPNNIDCQWVFKTSPGNALTLSFNDFELDGGFNDDYVEIRAPEITNYIGRWYGNNGPFNLSSSYAGAIVIFRTNEANTGKGFAGSWAATTSNQLTGDDGQISSPHYPSIYPGSGFYTWTIITSQDKQLQVTFNEFVLELSQNCRYDFVEIFDGSRDTGTSLGKWCGTSLPPPVRSTGNVMTVVFVTDDHDNFRGFLLTWNSFYSQNSPETTAVGCGGTLIANWTNQELYTPNFPNNYPDYANCKWTILAPEGYSIKAQINSLVVEDCCDYIQFYNGLGWNDINKISQRATNENFPAFISPGNTLGVLFHSDFSINRSGGNITYTQVCGSIMEQVSGGTITSPFYPENFTPNQTCIWKISVRPGRTIRLTFNQQFDIPDTNPCANQYLKILNGLTPSSPPLGTQNGTYCGTVAPQILETSSNYLFVQFVSGSSGLGSGFSFTFSEVSLDCSDHIILSHSRPSGLIEPPRNNGSTYYMPNLDCKWVITAPAGERVRLDFDDRFEIQVRDGVCNSYFIELHDGGTISSPTIGQRLCGTSKPGTIYSTNNVLLARFRTDHPVNGWGFKANYSIATCGGTIIGASGTITSPNYPGNYRINTECEWSVVAPVGHYIIFNITNFNLQSSTNCTADFLHINDGNATDPNIFHSCGSVSGVQRVETSDNTAYIKFRSDSSSTAAGFRIVFQASVESCGGTLTAPTGVLTSPNYPGFYAHNRRCVWQIEVETGRKVTLTFNDMRLSRGFFMCSDYVTVYNGFLPRAMRLGTYCNTVPQPVSSSMNKMTVIFYTNGHGTNNGFRATYTSDTEADCGGYLTNSTGRITFPVYNGSLATPQHNQFCEWKIHNYQINSSININLAFAIEDSPICSFDYLEIFEGNIADNVLYKRYCGTRNDRAIIPDNDALVRFATDVNVASRFEINYEFTTCGGILTEPNGIISSPGYPNGNTGSNYCSWKISAPEGSVIELSNWDFEFPLNCSEENLILQNGGSQDSPNVGVFCSGTSPPSFTSQSNELRLTLVKSNSSVPRRGFRVEYSFTSSSCNRLFNSNSGQLKSPNYPSRYPHNIECVWEINVDPGYHIVLNFNPHFDLEADSDCEFDHVEVFDSVNETQQLLGKFCRNHAPPPQISKSNKMKVIFRSDLDSNGIGFSANWTSLCGGVFTSPQGSILSPGYPNNYPNNLVCNYTIKASKNQIITLEFLDIELEAPSGYYRYYCRDYVLFPSSGQRICGSNTFYSKISTQNELHFQFITNSYRSNKGFHAHYTTEECGGDFTEPNGTIAYTRTLQHQSDVNCFWNITANNKIIKFKLESWNSYYWHSCFNGFLNLYDGRNLNASEILHFCGPLNNQMPIYASSGDSMYIHFNRKPYGQITFTGTYYTTYGPLQGCGGTLRQPSGTIRSLDINNDGQYEPDLECNWLIFVGTNKAINFTVNNIDIEYHINCERDSLTVYDGLTVDHRILGSYCGQQIPQTVRSSGNVILVIFKTDSVTSGRGFNATFQEIDVVCGGGYNATNVTQTISYSAQPDTTQHCHWTIDSGSVDQTIRIDFTDFQLTDSEFVRLSDHPVGQEKTYRGAAIPPTFYSTSQQIFIESQLSSSSASRFQLNYTLSDCHRNYTHSSGRLTSPNYPTPYQHNLNCTYFITSPERTTISLYFNDFNLENHYLCEYDSLQVLNSSSLRVNKLCGSYIPDPIHLNDNIVTLRLITDQSVPQRGFDITYVASTQSPGCGGAIEGISTGVITSPNFPATFTRNETCAWYITPISSRPMYYWFTQVTAHDNPSSCSSNYINVYQGSTTDDQLLGQYCNEPSSPRLFSSPILVNYVSNGNGTVFKMKFSTNRSTFNPTSALYGR
ncbi:cubilin-like isoform X2 [Physella acuta]|uniref:cubilin-like isoform X2 n=1 Tax=Physella acuta TaxID=109671 RepID=UPI0027DABF41|nr:cubilin-like isoform X2 [Physella acuta]